MTATGVICARCLLLQSVKGGWATSTKLVSYVPGACRYDDAYAYQNVFGPLVALEAAHDRAMKESQVHSLHRPCPIGLSLHLGDPACTLGSLLLQRGISGGCCLLAWRGS